MVAEGETGAETNSDGGRDRPLGVRERQPVEEKLSGSVVANIANNSSGLCLSVACFDSDLCVQ